VIIMTSNLGSSEIVQYRDQKDRQAKAVEDILRSTFRPEFLNRVDDIIIFQALTKDDIAKIVELQMHLVSKRLEKKGITIRMTEAASQYLAKEGFDEMYGARPLKRLIQNEILDDLSLKIIEGDIAEGASVSIDVENGKVVLIKGKR
jgi:ATP-dependent Clp protease ATP-binding subunit ClpB